MSQIEMRLKMGAARAIMPQDQSLHNPTTGKRLQMFARQRAALREQGNGN
jgi:hypothetical protein